MQLRGNYEENVINKGGLKLSYGLQRQRVMESPYQQTKMEVYEEI